MPEIDSDLFQLIALVLLVLLLVMSLLLLNAVQKLAKNPPAERASEPRHDTPHDAWSSQTSQQQLQHGQQPAQAEPVAQTGSFSYPDQSQASYSGGAQAGYGAGYAGAGETSSGGSDAGGGATTAFEPVPAAAPAEQMPEEQPFERDGRWWFKRGNELLVYNEQSGQWQPAPEGALGGTTSGSAFASFADAGGAQAGSGQAGTAQGADAGGWRCPSCGAVNGSTATTCRMCFASRP